PAATTGVFNNTVSVTPPLGTTDPVPGNNQATDTNPAGPQADLVLGKSVSNATPNVGSNVTFTLNLSNSGPSVASNVVVKDLLPTGYALVTATPSQGSYDSGSGVWTVGTLANGGSATLTLTATVLASGNYLNSASASASTPDPNSANNNASVGTTPVPVADV